MKNALVERVGVRYGMATRERSTSSPACHLGWVLSTDKVSRAFRLAPHRHGSRARQNPERMATRGSLIEVVAISRSEFSRCPWA